MATYETRGNSVRAQIRRKGFKTLNATFDNQRDAEIWATQQEALMLSNRYVDLREATKVTLADGLKKYLDERTDAKKGADQEATRIRTWLKRPLAQKALSDVTSKDLADYRDMRLKEGRSASTIRSELSIISTLYVTYDKEWGMPGLPNPMKSVSLPKVDNERDRRLTDSEMERLIDAAKEKHVEMPLILQLLIETAMRRSELLTVDRSQISGRVLTLSTTKNGTRRRVPLSRRALELLSLLPEREDGKLFSLKPNSVTNYVALIREKARVEDIRLHDMRHEGISRLFEKGLDIMEVAAISGHKTLTQLKRYVHLKAENLAHKLD